MTNQPNKSEMSDIHNFTNDLISDFISTLSIKQFIKDVSHVLYNATSTIFQTNKIKKAGIPDHKATNAP